MDLVTRSLGRVRRRVRDGALLLLIGLAARAGAAEPDEARPAPRPMTLRDCLVLALQNNRDLQIERINPVVARSLIAAAEGVYDPVLLADLRRESAADTGGFDPTDFSRDAIYSAESVSSHAGLTGLLPWGMTYTVGTSYAQSDGLRNLLNFESYSLFAGITVRQPLLRNFWIDQGRLAIKVSRKNLRITELGVHYLAMDVANRVAQAFYELLHAREGQAIQEEMVALRRQTLHGLERRLQQGLAVPADLLPSEAQLGLAEAEAAALRGAVTLAANRLRNLLADDLRVPVPGDLVPGQRLWMLPESLDVQASWTRGLEQRPDLAQLREDVARADLDLKYRRNQLFPSLDLVASYGRRGASTAQMPPPLEASASFDDAVEQVADGVAPSDMVGVIFSLPLGRVGERANHRVSRQLKAQAELRVRQREELVLQEIADAVSRVRVGRERVEAARRASAAARQAFQAEERKLAGGQSSLFFVLQSQTDLGAARRLEVRALAEYNQAVSQLHFAEASILDRHQLTFEIE